MKKVNKDYLILTFDIHLKKSKIKDKNKLRQRQWDNAGFVTKFHEELINKFCSRTWEDLTISHFSGKEKYKKEWLYNGFEIGFDMLHEEIGFFKEIHWDQTYYYIPKTNKELIHFFINQNYPFPIKMVSKM